MPNESKTTIRIDTEGHEQAAAQEDRVAESQLKNADAAERKARAFEGAARSTASTDGPNTSLQKSTNELTEATDGQTASVLSLREEIEKISPQLGDMFRTMDGTIGIVGRLGDQNIKLGDTFKTLIGLVGKFSKSLLTLGAGGAAFFAVKHFWDTLKGVNRELEDMVRNADRANQAIAKLGESRRALAVQALTDAGIGSPEALPGAIARIGRLASLGIDEGLAAKVVAAYAKDPKEDDPLLFAAAVAASGKASPESRNFRSTVDRLNTEENKVVIDQLRLMLQEGRRAEERFKSQLATFDVETVNRGKGREFYRSVDRGPLDVELAKEIFGVTDEEEVKKRFRRLQEVYVEQLTRDHGGNPYAFVDRPIPNDPLTVEMVNLLRSIDSRLEQSQRIQGQITNIDRQYIQGGGGPRGGAPGQARRDLTGTR